MLALTHAILPSSIVSAPVEVSLINTSLVERILGFKKSQNAFKPCVRTGQDGENQGVFGWLRLQKRSETETGCLSLIRAIAGYGQRPTLARQQSAQHRWGIIGGNFWHFR